MRRTIKADLPAMLPQTLLSQVSWNCRVASAGQAGHFSLCGLLLRLRQLYKWEHLLPPWREPESDAVLSWIEDRERDWESLEGAPWRRVGWGETSFDPFAVESLNEYLLPQGFAYGAGLARGLTPTFFLGKLLEVRRQGELTILVLGPELARDLDATPALRQGPLIYARKQALAFYLWDRLSDPVQQNNSFLKVALPAYDLRLPALLQDPEAHQEQFNAFLAAELEAVIHHELGEALEPSLRDAFPTLLERYPQTRVELWIRAVKDCLAEVNEWGRLAYLIRERRLPSLAVLLAWRPGLYSLLMPELVPAFWELHRRGDWDVMEQARLGALKRLRNVAAEINTLLAAPESDSPEWTRGRIEQRYLAPLGL